MEEKVGIGTLAALNNSTRRGYRPAAGRKNFVGLISPVGSISVAAPDSLATSLAGQRLLHPLFFARLEIEGVSFHFLDDIFLLNSSLEPAKRVFQGLPILESYFGH
jgi:hypothetical protein